MRIALATSYDLPDGDPDDAALVDALRERGVDTAFRPWEGPREAFVSPHVDLTLIRSTWDYTQKREAFVAWADDVDARGMLLNKPAFVRWNTDKRYLLELHKQGIAIVPTVVVPQGSARLRDVVDVAGFRSGVVIKPVIGAGSRATVVVPAARIDDDGQAFVDEHLPHEALLVQPFLARIAAGETSLIYLDGALSHVVTKTPADGDFRSQPEFGSRVLATTATPAQRALADDALRLVGGDPLYARVDVVEGDDGAPRLMELELVEPSLYFAWGPGSAGRCADAAIRRARARR